MSSAARALFDRFKIGGLAIIQATVPEQWQEDLLLDFKLAENNAAPMSVKDRQTLAEALSGFANSDGGIIIWGIYAAANNSGDPDVAKELKPIHNFARFLSDLQSFTPQVISPAILGVEHHPIEDPSIPDTGYVVTYVPKAEGEPHMARARDQHRFYYRSGCAFLAMESFMLSDRYGRRPQPKLELAWNIIRGSSQGSAENPIKITVHIILGIQNSGLGIATFPALTLYENENFKVDSYGLDGNIRTGLPKRLTSPYPANRHIHFFAGGINDVVHPGTTLEVTRASYTLPVEVDVIPDPLIQYDLHCQGFSSSGEIIIHLAEHFRQIRGF